MSPYRRNIMVGITVTGALVALGWMILKFGDRPARFFAVESMPITFMTDRADGLGEGSNMTYRGVIVGKINSIARSKDGKGVIVNAEVDKEPPLPANLRGEITIVSALGGTSMMVLQLTGTEEQGTLQKDARLEAHFVGLQMLPPEFADLARELKATAAQVRQSKVIENVNEQVTKAGKLLESTNELIADPKLRDDIKVAMSNIRQASETMNRVGGKIEKLSEDVSATNGELKLTVKNVGGNVDTLTKQMGERLQQISKTLDHFQSIAAKIDNGQGTAGQLINDPKLYQSMVDTSRELNATIIDLKRLVEQWEQEGLHFKLGK